MYEFEKMSATIIRMLEKPNAIHGELPESIDIAMTTLTRAEQAEFISQFDAHPRLRAEMHYRPRSDNTFTSCCRVKMVAETQYI
jgi:hypothetical protein